MTVHISYLFKPKLHLSMDLRVIGPLCSSFQCATLGKKRGDESSLLELPEPRITGACCQALTLFTPCCQVVVVYS